MKKILLTGTALLFLGVSPAHAENTVHNEKAMKVTRYDNEKPTGGLEEYFTGHVTVGTIFSSEYKDYEGAMVSFDAGARTAWHTHPKGQTLVIVSGEGRAQTEGEAVQVLKPGDIVWIPADERHWHGAAPNSAMSHVAIHSPNENGDVVKWMEQVSDEDYLSSE